MSAVRDLVRWGEAVLSTADTPRLDAELLLAHAAGTRRSAVLAFPERAVSIDVERVYRDAVRLRGDGVPLAYITGRKEFFSLLLEVSRDVLVPRPETELLVEEALARLPRSQAASVLDLGTGSGAIALALGHQRPAARVTAVDASQAALALAARNAARLGIEVRFIASDWFAALADERFDLIVANPPYVRSDDEHFAGPLRFEPREALDGGPDGLIAYRAIFAAAPDHLAPAAALLVEHGHDQARAIADLAQHHALNVTATRKDLSGHDRLTILQPAR